MRFHISLVGLTAGVLLLLGAAEVALAADPAFVGRLALAVDPQVAKDLGLDDEVKTKLAALINEREKEALGVVAKVRGKPQAEQDALLAPFVKESEKMGLALLTNDQIAKLSKLYIASKGMAGLVEADIAEQLNLTAEQKEEIAKQTAEYKKSLTSLNDSQKRFARQIFDKKIAGLLNDEQKASYEKISGVVMANLLAQGAGSQGPAGGASRSGGAGGAAGQRPADSVAEFTVTPGGKMKFNFKYAPWKDVIEFFARQADLALVTDTFPNGVFNYTDSKEYTPEQALNIINRVLATRGYMLVKYERMLFLFNVADGAIPNIFVETIEPKDLENKGDFEFVSVVFQLSRLSPEEADVDCRKYLGPQGSVQLFSKARQIMISDNVMNLRKIKRMIDAAEGGGVQGDERTTVIRLKYVMPMEFMQIARPLLRIPENQSATPDVSLVADELGGRIFVSGKQAMIDRVQEIVKLIDVKPETTTESGSGAGVVAEQPQFLTYPITKADPNLVLNVIATILAGTPNTKAYVDPKTGVIVALATPTVHRTIRAIIDEMQRDGMVTDVFKLRKMEPQTAVLAINKLFGGATTTDTAGRTQTTTASGGLRAEADQANMQITVRGSAPQVAEVKAWLVKIGELPPGYDGIAGPQGALAESKTPYRILPLSNRVMRNVFGDLESTWSNLRENKIRVIAPPGSPLAAPADEPAPPTVDLRANPLRGRTPQDAMRVPPAKSAPPASPSAPRGGGPPPRPEAKPAPAPKKEDVTPTKSPPWRFQFVSEPGVITGGGEAAAPAEQAQPAQPETPADEPAEIVVRVTPAGVILSLFKASGGEPSQADWAALDEFESLLQQLIEADERRGKRMEVYYLRFAKADAATVLLQEMLTGGANMSADTGGSLAGDIAANMLGGIPGMGFMNQFMPGGGGSSNVGGTITTTSGSGVTITPDPRLNALYVTAMPRELDSVEQMLQLIDRADSPEMQETQGKPRFIPIVHGKAEDMAVVVRQVYVNRIIADTSSPQARPIGPEDFLRAALTGGRGGGGRGGFGGGRGNQPSRGEEQKMALGVDTKSNSLIIAAPENLYNEVKLFVQALDVAAVVPNESVRVVTLKRASSDQVTRTLKGMLGVNATVNQSFPTTSTLPGTALPTRPTTGQTAGNQNNQQRTPAQQQALQQAMQLFNQGQGGFGGRGGGPGGFGGPGGGGFGGGRGGFGGPGGGGFGGPGGGGNNFGGRGGGGPGGGGFGGGGGGRGGGGFGGPGGGGFGGGGGGNRGGRGGN